MIICTVANVFPLEKQNLNQKSIHVNLCFQLYMIEVNHHNYHNLKNTTNNADWTKLQCSQLIYISNHEMCIYNLIRVQKDQRWIFSENYSSKMSRDRKITYRRTVCTLEGLRYSQCNCKGEWKFLFKDKILRWNSGFAWFMVKYRFSQGKTGFWNDVII